MNAQNPSEEIPIALALVIFRRMIEKYEIPQAKSKKGKPKEYDKAI